MATEPPARSGRRRALALLLLATVVVAGWTAYSRTRPVLQYRVVVSENSREPIAIEVIVPVAAAADTVQFVARLQDEAMNVGEVSAVGPSGDSCRVLIRRVVREHQDAPFHFVEVRVPNDGYSTLRIRYEVTPGIAAGDPAHEGSSTTYYGESGLTWRLTSLAQMLLVPKAGVRDGRTALEYDMPRGWRPIAAVGGGYLPRGGGSVRLQEAFFAPLVLGAVPHRDDGYLRVTMLSEPGMPASPGAMERVCGDLAWLSTRVATTLGQDLDSGYLVVVTEPDSNGFEAFVEPGYYGQVASARDGNLLHPLAVTKAMVERALEQQHLAERFPESRDLWFGRALPGYLAYLLTRDRFETRAPSPRTQYESILESDDIVLSSPEAARRRGPVAARGAALLECFDVHLRSESGDSLASFLRAMPSGKGPTSLQAAMETHYGRPLAGFFDRYIYAREPLPFAGTQVASLHPQELTTRVSEIADSVAILVTDDGRSHLENCGCRVNQAGGVARMATWIKQRRAQFRGPCFVMSIGNAFPMDQKNVVLDDVHDRELGLYLELLAASGFDAAVVGETELFYGPDRFRRHARASALPYVSTNVVDSAMPMTPVSVRLDRAGTELTVLGVTRPLSHPLFDGLWNTRTAGLRFRDPVTAVAEAAANAGGIVVVAGGVDPAMSRAILAAVPRVNVVVSFIPQGLCSDAQGKVYITDRAGFVGDDLVLYSRLGSYGMSEFVLYRDREGRIVDFREAHHFVDETVGYDPAARERIDRFYRETAASFGDLDAVDTGLWKDSTVSFVGADACKDCHESEHEQWALTVHATAFKTLLEAHRHYSPRCVACHVTGFNRPSGYRFGDMDSAYRGVQCEVCHGPGGDHAAEPEAAAMVRDPGAGLCMRCHDTEHSEMGEGRVEEYWNQVVH